MDSAPYHAYGLQKYHMTCTTNFTENNMSQAEILSAQMSLDKWKLQKY